jgi:type I restriction enzyme S subunit
MNQYKYPAYKPSGVERIGEVPEHWKVLRGDYIFQLTRIGVTKEELTGQSFYHYSIPSVQEFQDATLETGEDVDSNKFIVQGNEVLYSKLNPRKETVIITKSREHLQICSTEFLVLRPKACDLRFAYYMLVSHSTKERVCASVQSSTKSHQRANPDDIYKIKYVVPSRKEQETIASYLDEKTTLIDNTIRKKQRLIELLQEERTAFINHAVTQGLDSNIPMKTSGVEWLGEIPAHWEVMPLKRDIEFLTSGSRGWAEHYSETGDLFIRIGNLTRNSILLDLTDKKFVIVPEGTEGARTIVQAGDVLVSITAYLGSVAVVPELKERAYVSQHVALVRLHQHKVCSEWVAYFLLSQAGKRYFEMQGYGGTKVQLSLDDIRMITISVPPLQEQQKILCAIAEVNNTVERAKGRIEREITLLREYRTALINEVVTGKHCVVPQPEALTAL